MLKNQMTMMTTERFSIIKLKRTKNISSHKLRATMMITKESKKNSTHKKNHLCKTLLVLLVFCPILVRFTPITIYYDINNNLK